MKRELSPSFDQEEPIPEARRVQRVERMQLQPDKLIEIDITHTLADADFLQSEIGVDGALIASVRAGKTDFLLIDTRNSSNYFMPFLLASDDYEYGAPQGYKGIYAHEPVVIGRGRYMNRFPDDRMMSRNHFSVVYDDQADKLFIKDEASTNGTYLSGFTPDVDEQSAGKLIDHDLTYRVVAELEGQRNYGDKTPDAPYGTRSNHPIIGRDSPTMRNGVYGTRSSEFVVVDHKSRLLKRVVEDFMMTLPGHEEAMTMDTESLLKRVSFRVSNILRYDLDEVERISAPHYGNKGLVDLSEYVEAGVGVCRHQALLAALIIEEAIERGHLAGRVGVERNYDKEANGAHAWAVYKSDTSEDIIVDPANHFVGSRKKAQQEGRWRYVVAEDNN